MAVSTLFTCAIQADEGHTLLSIAAKEKMDSLGIRISASIEGKKPHGYLAKLTDGSEIFIVTNSVSPSSGRLEGVTVYPIGKYSYATDDTGDMTTVRKVTDDLGLAADYVLAAGVPQVNDEEVADGFPPWSAQQQPSSINPTNQEVNSDLHTLPSINSPALEPTPGAVSSSASSTTEPVLGDLSPSVLATELGRYKAKVYRAVGAQWYNKVNQQIQVLGVGTVHVTYTISKDGILTITGDPDSTNPSLILLHSISINAMTEAAPFDHFSPAMIKEVGDSFTDEFSFSVKGE